MDEAVSKERSVAGGLAARPRAWYALRRTLPPWSFKENLSELIELCPQYCIDEVIVKVDTEEFSHGQPTLEWIKNYQPHLFEIKEELNKIGVVFSINPWVTLGPGDRGRDCTKMFPDMGFMVGHDGTTCKTCCCPLSEGWRTHIGNLWKVYAETEPHVLWVEDDIRTFWHPPVRVGCFCSAHLARFSEKVGRRVTREELVEAVLLPGTPHPFRKMWLDFQGEVMVEVAATLEKAVHGVSPQTRLGLMSSQPSHHAIEGRDWHAFAEALSGPHNLVSRPCLLNYSENSFRGLYVSSHHLRLTRYCLPTNVTVQTEVENFPYTRYSKSNRFTFVQMALSFAMGSDGVTLNLCDHCGTAMKSDPMIGQMLTDSKTFLNGICQRCFPAGIFSGIRILHHPRASDEMVLEKNAGYYDLVQDGYQWQSILESLGFATTFSESDVVALSGQTIRAFNDDEVRAFLAKAVLIDLSAARVLIERGFGEFLGVSIKREFAIHANEPLSAEEFFDVEFGGRPRTYLTVTLHQDEGAPTVGELTLSPGARTISRLVDPDTVERYPFLTIFENSLGGRVAIYPIDMTEVRETAFLNHHRQKQLYHVLRWLSRDRLPLFVEGGVYPLAFRLDYDKRTIVGIFNLSLDPWPSVKVRLHADGKEVTSVDILDAAGKWVTREDVRSHKAEKNVQIEIGDSLSFEEPIIISVNWRG